MDLIKETLDAFKSRIAGPFGTYALVWMLAHPKVVAFFLFDAITPGSGQSSAEAKIAKISAVLSPESPWILFGRPALFTLVVFLTYGVVRVIWHALGEFFRKIISQRTAKTDFELAMTQYFGRSGREIVSSTLTTINNAHGALAHPNFPNLGPHADPLQQTNARFDHLLRLRDGAVKDLERVMDQLNRTSDVPEISWLGFLWRKKAKAGP